MFQKKAEAGILTSGKRKLRGKERNHLLIAWESLSAGGSRPAEDNTETHCFNWLPL